MRYLLLPCLLFLFSCTSKVTKLSGESIIEKSIQKHDPKNQWPTAKIHLRIQEPRIQNPIRYSIVELNNTTGTFTLQRNREDRVSTHSIDGNGKAITYLDDKIVLDSILIKKYRLEPQRNFSYRRYYQSLMGLPMSLHIEKLDSVSNVSEVIFNNIESYKVSVEFNKPLFTKYWNLYFSKEDFTIIGVEIRSPDNPEKGESLYFEGNIQIGSFTISRSKHWHDLSGEYLGSDIIIKEIK